MPGSSSSKTLERLPAGLILREYRAEDREACLALLASNADLLPPDSPEHYEDWLEGGASYHIVMEQAGRVLASGGLDIQGGRNACHLVHGLVLREFHGRGLGTLLTLLRFALVPDEFDPSFVGLETSVRTESFYLRFGFERLNKPSARYAGASFFVDLGAWISVPQKEEIRSLLGRMPLTCLLDFSEARHPVTEEEEQAS